MSRNYAWRHEVEKAFRATAISDRKCAKLISITEHVVDGRLTKANIVNTHIHLWHFSQRVEGWGSRGRKSRPIIITQSQNVRSPPAAAGALNFNARAALNVHSREQVMHNHGRISWYCFGPRRRPEHTRAAGSLNYSPAGRPAPTSYSQRECARVSNAGNTHILYDSVAYKSVFPERGEHDGLMFQMCVENE